MKLLVWDFHGVLEKGTERAAIIVSNQVLDSFGYEQRFSDDDIERLYGRKWYEYFEARLPQEPHERHLELQEAAFNYDAAHPEIAAACTRANEHAREVVLAIERHGHGQVVISNTKQEALRRFVELVGLNDVLGAAQCLAVDRHGRDVKRAKADVLREYLATHPAEQLVFVGDTPADMEFAKQMGGVKFYYVHPGRPFSPVSADYRINDLREVLVCL